jgi:hypothetical protein
VKWEEEEEEAGDGAAAVPTLLNLTAAAPPGTRAGVEAGPPALPLLRLGLLEVKQQPIVLASSRGRGRNSDAPPFSCVAQQSDCFRMSGCEA